MKWELTYCQEGKALSILGAHLCKRTREYTGRLHISICIEKTLKNIA